MFGLEKEKFKSVSEIMQVANYKNTSGTSWITKDGRFVFCKNRKAQWFWTVVKSDGEDFQYRINQISRPPYPKTFDTRKQAIETLYSFVYDIIDQESVDKTLVKHNKTKVVFKSLPFEIKGKTGTWVMKFSVLPNWLYKELEYLEKPEYKTVTEAVEKVIEAFYKKNLCFKSNDPRQAKQFRRVLGPFLVNNGMEFAKNTTKSNTCGTGTIIKK